MLNFGDDSYLTQEQEELIMRHQGGVDKVSDYQEKLPNEDEQQQSILRALMLQQDRDGRIVR